MHKSRDDLKILLLQIREDEITMLEEFYEFVQYSQLKENQVDKLNTYTANEFKPEIINGYDALFVGGSSDASVLKPNEYVFIHDCKRLIRYCYQQSIPVLASCFGFQLAVAAFDGEVILDQENMEMGMYEIFLTDAAKQDSLLSDMPSKFWAVSGHKERALKLPKNAINLAYSDACPFHIFKFSDKPFYGFQFHPEVDKKDLIARVTRYQTRYLEDAQALQQIIDAANHETIEANNLIAQFIDKIVLSRT